MLHVSMVTHICTHIVTTTTNSLWCIFCFTKSSSIVRNDVGFQWKRVPVADKTLSHDAGSDMTLCNKIDKPLLVYKFSGNVITFIVTFRKRWRNLDVFTSKVRFLINLNVT